MRALKGLAVQVLSGAPEGKIIIVCNTFPSGPDADAVKSRSLCHKIEINLESAKRILTDAAENPKWFDNIGVSKIAAEYIISGLTDQNLSRVSLRTLRMAYVSDFHDMCQAIS